MKCTIIGACGLILEQKICKIMPNTAAPPPPHPIPPWLGYWPLCTEVNLVKYTSEPLAI